MRKLTNSKPVPRKAPKVAPPSKEKPNYMRESDSTPRRRNPMAPMTKKRLSK